MRDGHRFHIPVMGIGFTIDTPIKVARYGISSVISLVDDQLIEEMRKVYVEKCGDEYTPITKDDDDYRARRITAYLDLVDQIVKKQFEELRNSPFEHDTEITRYFKLLPDNAPLRILYNEMNSTQDTERKTKLQDELRKRMTPGSIDVNIMTKLDTPHYAKDGTELDAEYSDALSALRGYAQSTLNSAIVFSAGINRRLYGYAESFKDFFADAKGSIKKKIILKVSDYRSALTQGKFFAKKGMWISEYRVESGLNCGGHAFATAGYLMGPILEEFRTKKKDLIEALHKAYNQARILKNMTPFSKPHEIEITAQGGIGTIEEKGFLRKYFGIDATGWATPFMLVPEVVNVDPNTLQKLADSKEDDLYISSVSPLNVPFNNLRKSPSDCAKEKRTQDGHPGSPCPKGHLRFNTEFTKHPICAASRQYQKLKLESLAQQNLSKEDYERQCEKIVRKACICTDLSGSVMINYGIKSGSAPTPAVCPGPNLAFFSKIVTLKEMVDHIYGRINLITHPARPHMFVTELAMYVDHLKKEVYDCVGKPTEKQVQYFHEFTTNLLHGIEYYQKLFSEVIEETAEKKKAILKEVNDLKQNIEDFIAINRYAFDCIPA